jgi:hypothetical protein
MGVGRVGDHHRTVGSGSFGKNEIGTGERLIAEGGKQQRQDEHGFSHRIFLLFVPKLQKISDS